MKKIIILIGLSVVLFSCATYNVSQNKSSNKIKEKISETKDIAFSFYLIGDAGKSSKDEPNIVLNALKKELDKATHNSSILFLGDNIYPDGLPKKNAKNRSKAENSLNSQIDIVKNYKGKVLFIPGNHDWRRGVNGVKREAKYIEKALNNSKVFFPSKGCPIAQIKINDGITIIAIDSQWYLENWDNNPTINDNCSIKTRESFFLELESLLKKNEGKTTLLVLHHPMFSNGPHGGQFSVRQQFKPLPILGSLESLIRKTGGVSLQDLQNKRYLELRKRVIALAQSNEKTILISGHEHNLQYLVKNNLPQIISGSGSKINPVRQNSDDFGYAGLGFAKLVVFKDNSSKILFYAVTGNTTSLVYQTTVLKSDKKYIAKDYPRNSKKTTLASIYTKEETTKKKSYKKLWGERYRDYYSKNIEANLVYLDTLYGGLTPVRKGGGHQTKSLRLVNNKGQQFVMRSLRKSATQYLQAVAFKDQYLDGKFDGSSVENLLLDIFTGSHPYAPLVVGTLADEAAVFHTNPKLFYVPKQNALKSFNTDFGDELYIIEERVTSGHGNLKSFGYADEVISTNDFFKSLRKNSENNLDEATYIRARLFDMLIGDWDRHEDQWRWAAFKNDNGHKTYKPIPRDRDQAFSIMSDGSFLSTTASLFPSMRFLKSYEAQLKSAKWFNLEPFPLDKALITKSDKAVWDAQVKFIQTHITDAIIEKAFAKMPSEMLDKTVADIKQKLKSRLQNLQQISDDYHKILNAFVIVKGSDKTDKFNITRLANGETNVKGYRLKKSDKEILFYDRTFKPFETKEIWIYALDDDDHFNVSGTHNSSIKIRLVGGQNNDVYDINKGNNVKIYDYKSKKNTFKTTKGHLKLTDNYDINVYDYKKPKYNAFQVLPSLGANKDDGLKIGVNNTFTVNKFERNPFTQQHKLSANYYLATSGYEFNYSGEFANLFNHWNFKLSTQYTSPNYSINFFGFGNESINLDDTLDDDYNRVKIKTFSVTPALVWHGQLGAQFSLGVSYESKSVENTTGRFINTTSEIPNSDFQTQHFIGTEMVYNFENFDHKAFPTLGLKTSLKLGYKSNTGSNKEFGYLIPSLGFDYKLDNNGTVVLATKIKAHITFGDGFEFYQAASLGANDGLRGFRNQRFTGKSAFYQNIDLRLKLTRSHTSFIPFRMGLFGGFDYGKVWIKQNDVNIWHTSYGGGLWFNGAGLISSRIGLFNSTDGALLSFGLGFGF